MPKNPEGEPTNKGQQLSPEAKAKRMTPEEIIELFRDEKIDEWADLIEQAEEARQEANPEPLLDQIDELFEATKSNLDELIAKNLDNYEEGVSEKADKIIDDYIQGARKILTGTKTGEMLDCIGKLVESINDFYNLTQAKSQELRKNGEENKRFRQFTRSISHNLINKFLGFKVPNSPLSNIGSRIRSMNDYEFSFSNTNLEEAIQILSKEKTVEAIEYTDHTIKNVIKGLGEVCSNLIEETQEFLYQDEEKARSELTDNQKIKLEEGGELKLVPDQKLRIFRYMREHKDEVTDLTTKYETWHFAGNAVTVE